VKKGAPGEAYLAGNVSKGTCVMTRLARALRLEKGRWRTAAQKLAQGSFYIWRSLYHVFSHVLYAGCTTGAYRTALQDRNKKSEVPSTARPHLLRYTTTTHPSPDELKRGLYRGSQQCKGSRHNGPRPIALFNSPLAH
jgi:hypothetical protein